MSYNKNSKLTAVPRKGWGLVQQARGLGAPADRELHTSCDLLPEKPVIAGLGFSNKSVTEIIVCSHFVKCDLLVFEDFVQM